VLVGCLVSIAIALAAEPDRVVIGDRALSLTRDAVWTAVRSIPVAAPAHHPQGLVKVGDAIFVSTVEVRRRRQGGADPGEGVGHLLQLDLSGRLVRRIRLGDGALYHPGGVDFDGTHLWVPVAEYRPDSRTIVYRVDPRTLIATEVFRYGDHLGAVACDADDRSLHAVSWGSRRFYRWALDDEGRPRHAEAPRRLDNVSHYVDYQDCKYAGRHRMLCSGVSTIRTGDRGAVEFGGLDVIDLSDGRPILQVPIGLRTSSGRSMTRNPSWFEPTGAGLRAYFMPEDDRSSIHVFDVEPAPRGASGPW
jgi:hypothetical protein